APAEDRQPVTEARVEEAMRTQGAALRRAVRAALGAVSRFVPCQTLQGNIWCLAEMLPSVSQASLQKVLVALPKELSSEESVSLTTEELVSTVWGLEDDGSDAYALHAFALRRALDGLKDVVSLGDRWTSAQAWEAFTTRQTLDVPRMPSQVPLPDGIDVATEAQIEQEQRREAAGEGEETEVEGPVQEDMETWRLDRPVHAVFTLRARHYHEGWLPLSKQVRRLFPPLASGRQEVVFHHHFGDEPTSLRAFVDRDEGRIWVFPEMYETFRRHRVYPGARLRLSARNEREYDIATRETDRTDPIRVWRMWLDEEGRIEYEEHEEPRRYDVADDVYVADVRFEDREALFRQAEEVGNSIFGLMYKQAVEWWEAGGRGELVVTPDRLFESIHFDEQGRMVSKATIAWELWQRLAFLPLGGGRYRFRPEFGDYLRSTGLAPRRRRRRRRKTEPISECWAQVARLAGQELRTLARGHPFRVLNVGDKTLQIRVGTSGQTRTIRQREIETAWEHLTHEESISQTEIHKQYHGFNSGYVATILAALPCVTYQIRPIRLTYRPPSEEPPALLPTTEPAAPPSPELAEPVSEFWAEITRLAGRGIRTLGKGAVFDVLDVDDKAVRIKIASTGRDGAIYRRELESMWSVLTQQGELPQTVMRNQYSQFKAAYITAILATLPGVTHQINPVRLTYRPPSEEPPAPTLERTRTGQLVAAELVPPGPLFEQSPQPLQPDASEPASADKSSDEKLQSDIEAEFRQIQEIVRASLVGKTIYTLVQAKPNRIIDADDEGLTVAARNVRKLPWEWIEDVYKALRHLGEIEAKDVQEGEFRGPGGFRCAFVFPLLARFAHIEAHIKPRRRLVYHKPEGTIHLSDAAETVASTPEADREPEPGAKPSEDTQASQAPGSTPASAQKPMEPPPPSQPPPPSPPPRRSRSSSKPLFSQHYLTHRIQDHSEWDVEVSEPFRRLRALYEEKRGFLSTLNEAQTEAEFIRPVLEILGFAYIPQTTTRRAGRVQRPDYALFADDETKAGAYPFQEDNEPAFYARALAIADAKYWERSLSEARRDDPRDVFKNSNPSFQIVNYLTGTGVDWGILT
ncbi:MAG: hypothetical protein IMY86_03615, partial [Chloroflexi bacterium]|nr:hypothetical protein [Chloroflexota bacterium]